MTTSSSSLPAAARASSPARRASLILGVVLTVGGCGLLRSPTAPPTTFYVLTATAEPGQVPAGRHLTLGLGPITLPPYLNRPEMVRRVAPNQLAFDEFNRWSEPLKDNVVRALGTDLDKLLGTERLIPYPWYSSTQMDYTVEVSILRFEPQPDGQVVLDARWSIGDSHGQQLVNHDSHFEHPAGSPPENAAALSTMLGELAHDIASALRTTGTVRSK
jgi:uncharacterized lipoprotein YmbA